MYFRRELGCAQAHLYSIWKPLAGKSLLPDKKAIGIGELRGLAAQYAIIHLDDSDTLSIMHSGTSFDELWGRNVVGRSVSELTAIEARPLLDWYFRSMLFQPCGGQSQQIFSKGHGERFLLDLLYLPIIVGNGDVGLAVMADIRNLSHAKYTPRLQHLPVTGHIVRHAEFVDIGFGLPKQHFSAKFPQQVAIQ